MSKPLECPVPYDSSEAGFAAFRFVAAQELIKRPESVDEILSIAAKGVKKYYKPATDKSKNLEFGQYKESRALRQIALSAALFNGATRWMNEVGPDLAELSELTPEAKGPTLTRWADPLPKLELYDSLRTLQTQCFMREVGGVMQKWAQLGMLEPEPVTQPVADAARASHMEFVKNEKIYNPDSKKTLDFDLFCRKSSEENSKVILGSVLGFAGSEQLLMDQSINPLKLANKLISNQHSIKDLASTYRRFSTSTTFPDTEAIHTTLLIEAYETALEERRPIPAQLIAPRFEPDDEYDGQMRPAYPVLKKGPWREAGMCAGFPAFEARTKEETEGNRLFFRAMGKLFGNQQRASTEQYRWSTVDVAVNVGVLASLYTVLVDFPSVDTGKN